MSDAIHPLWEAAGQAQDKSTPIDIHPLWEKSAPKSVIITPKSEEEDPVSRFQSGVKEQFSPAVVAGGVGSAVAPLAATAVGLGLSNRASFENPEQHQALIDKFKQAHDDTADAIKNGNYLKAAKIGQDLLLGEGMKEPVDMIEDHISKGDYAGAAGSTLSLLGQFALGHGIGKLTDMAGPWIDKLRTTPNPDLSLMHAAKPHAADTDFLDNIPAIRANVKRGEQITQKPITDVRSAIDATSAAMKEKMDVLDSDKAQTKLRGDQMSTATLKANAVKSLPPGLEDIDPEEYNRVFNEINKIFPNKHSLNTDEVFDRSHLVNGELHRFFAAPDATQRSKLVTNSGDTSILTSMAGDFSKWIKDHVGPLAAENNSDWGKMNQFRTYLQAKTNPSSLEKPVTNLESLFGNVGLAPGDKPGLSTIASGVVNKAVGRPTTIDGWIKAAFDNTEPAPPPLVKNVHQYNNPGNLTKQLPPSPDEGVNILPSSGSVMITPQNEKEVVSQALRDSLSQRPNASEVGNQDAGHRALPPATTIFQGDVSPSSGVPSAPEKTLPTKSDPSNVKLVSGDKFPEVMDTPTALRDKAAIRYTGRAYDKLSTSQKVTVDRIMDGKPLRLQDLQQLGQP